MCKWSNVHLLTCLPIINLNKWETKDQARCIIPNKINVHSGKKKKNVHVIWATRHILLVISITNMYEILILFWYTISGSLFIYTSSINFWVFSSRSGIFKIHKHGSTMENKKVNVQDGSTMGHRGHVRVSQLSFACFQAVTSLTNQAFYTLGWNEACRLSENMPENKIPKLLHQFEPKSIRY